MRFARWQGGDSRGDSKGEPDCDIVVDSNNKILLTPLLFVS
jgi:hypothetical protein